MSLLTPERLYQLLPSIHRLRDAAQGEPLRALLAVIESELEAVEADTARLYDNWFIETCDEWTVPYIGDLLGVRPVRPVPSAGVSMRAWVANTIAYRRRKGTALVLEQLARDVTGWPAVAVEFFQRLGTTQHLNHVRLRPAATASVRNAAAAELADGAFDPFAHTLEVRRAATRGGRFNIPHIGIYLWRLQAQPLGSGNPGDVAADFTSARPQPGFWSMHPAGVDAPVFNAPRTETASGAISPAAREEHVPAPLRRLALHAELERVRQGIEEPAARFMTAVGPVLRCFVQLVGETTPTEVPREDIYLCDIPDAVELALPTPRVLALDLARGRIDFPAALPVERVWLHAAHGSAAHIGGGPYDRGEALRAASRSLSAGTAAEDDTGGFFAPGVWQVGVTHLLPADGVLLFDSLRAAVAAWNAVPAGRTGVIVVMDSVSDIDTATPLRIDIAGASSLLIVAGQWPLQPIDGAPPGSVARVPGRFEARQVRAHWAGSLEVAGTADGGDANAGALFLHGLLLEGPLDVLDGNLGQLELAHCTLLPAAGGTGALTVQAGGNSRLELRVLNSICAPLTVNGPVRGVTVADSIVGQAQAQAQTQETATPPALDAFDTALNLLRSTFFGAVHALTLNASDCIFDAVVHAARRQTGCVRFSYVPPDSQVPRRYRCQPQLEAETRIAALRAQARAAGGATTPAEEEAVRAEVEAVVRPLFVSRIYGDPALGQLELRCALQIRTGAESGAEMGAYEHLQQPQREANLQDALHEYLRLGLEAGVFLVN